MSDMLCDFCFVKFSVKCTHSLARKGFLASGGKPKTRFVFQTYTKKTLVMIFNCSKFHRNWFNLVWISIADTH